MSDAVSLAAMVAAVLEATAGGVLTCSAAADLLRGGHAHVLIGQCESDWLEVKRRAYDLSKTAEKIELAQDVARFANGDSDGLLVCGMTARRAGGDEVIRSVVPLALPADTVRRYRSTLDARVFPPIRHLTVERVPAGAGELLMIHVPAQPEEAKPFLVHGAVVGGRVEGAFISIVRRRGEHSITVSPPAIHAQLAAGRALLRSAEATQAKGRRT